VGIIEKLRKLATNSFYHAAYEIVTAISTMNVDGAVDGLCECAASAQAVLLQIRPIEQDHRPACSVAYLQTRSRLSI
jgi:hypothetical protein